MRRRVRWGRLIPVTVTVAAGICALSLTLVGREEPSEPAASYAPAEITTIETTPTETPAPTTVMPVLVTEQSPEPGDGFVIYDIALSEELQRFTFDRCEELGLSYELVLAVMFKESSYRPHVVNSEQCYGLMQIHKINHPELEETLGITDFLDAEQNIIGGTYLLEQITSKYSDTHEILMVYNCGESGAKKLWAQGVGSTEYSRGVIEYIVAEDEYLELDGDYYHLEDCASDTALTLLLEKCGATRGVAEAEDPC